MRQAILCTLLIMLGSCKQAATVDYTDMAETTTAAPPGPAEIREGDITPTDTVATDTMVTTATYASAPPPRTAPRPASHPPALSRRPDRSKPPAPVREVELRHYVKVPVFYGTNRKIDGEDRQNVYGAQRGTLQYGVSWVSIPRSHQAGELEAPSIRTLSFREDPRRHVVLLEVNATPRDRWFARLNDSITDGGANQAFVFIHGFNVTFSEASRRTAQIKYDLGFDGPAILFSWPSLGSEAMYLADRETVDATVPVLVRFLVDLRRRTGATTIHLIAHSLGNRLLTRAVERIDLDTSIQPKPNFSQIMLAAPDVDAEVFRDELAPRMRKIARGITLYGSSDDRAILVSKRLNAIRRAGEGGENLPIVEGIDSIDVTGLDASFLKHSYIGGVSVLGDIAQLLCEGKTVADRVGIVRRAPTGWRLVVAAEERVPRPCRVLP